MQPNTRKFLTEDATFPTIPTTISPSQPSLTKRTSNTTSNLESSMIVTLLVLFTALFFMVFFSIYVRRFAEDNTTAAAAEIYPPRRQTRIGSGGALSSSSGVGPTLIRALPIFSFDGSGNCAICLCEFVLKETVKIIPRCRHVYHPECIDAWLCSHDSCPLCRSKQMFALEGEVLLDVCDEMDDRGRDAGGEVERRREEEEERELVVLRRASSWSGIGKRVMLQRSCSF